ncbi:MAG TPA: hypothetical protein VJ454_09985 [Steroidobacteraceae bacterium]|nr:hypothetical protein [Steroidobacteraceae bacterium]
MKLAIKLSEQDLDEIAAAIHHSNAGTGPSQLRWLGMGLDDLQE